MLMRALIVYTDIAKAFDDVCHCKFISKLSCYGNKRFNYWAGLNAFFLTRQHFGPLLFVVYINDLVNAVSLCSPSSLYLYVDGAIIFKMSLLMQRMIFLLIHAILIWSQPVLWKI